MIFIYNYKFSRAQIKMFVSGAGAVWSRLFCLEPEPTFFACLEPEPLSVPGPPTSEAAKEKWQLRSNGYRTGILKWISDGKQRMCKKNVTTYTVMYIVQY